MVHLNHLAGILWFVLITLALCGSGMRTMRSVRIKPLTLPGEFAISLAYGFAVYILAIQIIGRLGIISRPVLMGLTICGIAAGYKDLIGFLVRTRKAVSGRIDVNFIQAFILVIILVYMAVYFVACLAPVIKNDALYYHYFFPKDYLTTGKIHYNRGNIGSDYPFGQESLILLGLGTGGESSANLVNWLFMLGAIMLFMDIGAQLGSKEAGPVMAILLIGSHGFPDLILPGLVEMALAFLCIGAIYASINWMKEPDRAEAITVGLFFGLIGAVKYNGLMLVLYLLLACIIKALWGKGKSLKLRRLGIIILAMVIIMLPFEGRNLIIHGNPVYPFLQKALYGEVIPGADDIDTWKTRGKPTPLGGIEHFFIQSMDKEKIFFSYADILFPLLFLLLIRDPRVALLGVYTILHYALAYVMMPEYTRYLLPANIAMIFILGIAVARIKLRLPRQIFSVLLVVPVFMNVTWVALTAVDRLPAALGFQDAEEYLVKGDNFNSIIFELNRMAVKNENVLFLDRRNYRLNGICVSVLEGIPDGNFHDPQVARDVLVRNDIKWIAISRDYLDKLRSIDAILTSFRDNSDTEWIVYWDGITSRLDEMKVPYGFAEDIIFSMDGKAIRQGCYILNKQEFNTQFPEIGFYAALASMLNDMAEKGYLRQYEDNFAGAIYKVM